MRLAGKIFWGSISTLLVSSCFDPPQFPIIPDIGYKDIRFIDMPDPSPFEVATDSLVLELSFRDGDGDLGIRSSESNPPFNDRWYYLLQPIPNCDDNPNDGVNRCYELRLEEINKYVSYKLKRKPVNGSDTLKPFVKPYNCTNWEVVRDKAGKVLDTVYFQANPHYNNIFVEFQMKESSSSCSSPPCFSVFDWSQYLNYPSCEVQGFNGRFPYLNTQDLGETPLAGVIKYSMPSPFFKTIFGARTLRIRVYIEDRLQNRSNEVITPEFTLRQ
jgi:hypothetical protein